MIQKSQQYQIKINTSTLNNTSTKIQQIKSKYIPIYKHKLHFDRKNIYQPTEDRLSQLTTKQIDRIIQMEKIKLLLNDKQNNGSQYIHLNSTSFKHQHVYQSYFLAKINRIALNRNIRRQRSQEFDQNEVQLNHKNNKSVTISRLTNNHHKNIDNQSQVKSISSIEDNIDLFEQNIQSRRKIKTNSNKNNSTHLSNRWFQGLSNKYLIHQPSNLNQDQIRCIDMQYRTTNYWNQNKYQRKRFQ